MACPEQQSVSPDVWNFLREHHNLVETTGSNESLRKARVSPSFVDAFSRALKQYKQTEAFQDLRRKYSLVP